MKANLDLCQDEEPRMRNRKTPGRPEGHKSHLHRFRESLRSVPREKIWRCMRERNVPEKYVKLIQDMYRGCQTRVRSAAGESGSFNVDVGLDQGSALIPYLFLILMDVLTEGVSEEVPESMMFVDDIVLCGGREVDMTDYLDTWRQSLEERAMRVSRL